MGDSESEERLERAASLRRTVAETIARVRRNTAHIGVPRPAPGDPDAAEPPEAAPPADPPPLEPEPPRAEAPAEVLEEGGEGRLGRDVGALLERTRSVIERTRRVIEESKASLTHPRRPDPRADPRDDADEDSGTE